MAKRSSTPSADAPTTTVSRRKAAASNGDGQSLSDKKAKSSAQRGLSAEDVGYVAGEVWACLDRDGAQTVAAVKKAVDAPGDLVMAAIGWLAREDKLEFSRDRSVKISLR
jgi:hypothetical protein